MNIQDKVNSAAVQSDVDLLRHIDLAHKEHWRRLLTNLPIPRLIKEVLVSCFALDLYII